MGKRACIYDDILELRSFFHAEALVRCVLDGDIDRLTASVFPLTINNRR